MYGAFDYVNAELGELLLRGGDDAGGKSQLAKRVLEKLQLSHNDELVEEPVAIFLVNSGAGEPAFTLEYVKIAKDHPAKLVDGVLFLPVLVERKKEVGKPENHGEVNMVVKSMEDNHKVVWFSLQSLMVNMASRKKVWEYFGSQESADGIAKLSDRIITLG